MVAESTAVSRPVAVRPSRAGKRALVRIDKRFKIGQRISELVDVFRTRIGPDAEWFPDVFPGAFVFGLGLVTFVAPLTATVMAAADQRHVSVASGVNNAIARAASLTAHDELRTWPDEGDDGFYAARLA